MEKPTIAQFLKITHFPFIINDDKSGKSLYSENSSGFWIRREYDSNGNETYYENSNGTIITGTKKSNEVTLNITEKFDIPVWIS
jgi:hypothetical protein